jgi:hypothetical protein
MNLKLIIAVAALAAMPGLALAQQKGAPPPAAKPPTKAEVQKVVNAIKADKTKLDAYCQIAKLGDQMQAAAEKKDQKKMDDLNKQADALAQKVGPDYVKVTAGMEDVDPDSKDGKDLIAVFDSLDASCPK